MLVVVELVEETVVVVQNSTGFLLEEEAELGRVGVLVGFDQVGVAERVDKLELVAQKKNGV